MGIGTVAPDGVWSLSRALTVAIMPKGLRVPADDGQRSLPLDRAALELIVALASGGARPLDDVVADVIDRTGAPASALASLVAELTERQLLVRGDHPLGSPIGPPPERRAEVAGWHEGAVFVATTPRLLRVGPDGFDVVDHDGAVVIRLTVAELLVTCAFGRPTIVADALARLAEDRGSHGLADPELTMLVRQLMQAGLLVPFDYERSPQARSERELKEMGRRLGGFSLALERSLTEHEAASQRLEQETGRRRVRVVPMQIQPGLPPVALGMLFANAKAHDGGALEATFDFVPNWWVRDQDLQTYAEHPALYLFSNYVWSSNENLAMSAKAKDLNPGSIMVHGGPDTPRNAHDVLSFFADHPHVDVAVHGEGEVTTAEMLAALAGPLADHGRLDLEALRSVPGLSFRSGDEIVRTPDRERQADLDLLPSPYLSGLFHVFEDGNGSTAILETNRGCPYGCTFCDWGSATLSRIRKFDLERIFAELEWCAKNEISRIFMADANFGIMERDVAIAEKVAELKTTYGYPRAFATNYAKNTVKHLKRIVEVMVEADVLTEGLLSLQTMDEDTLRTIKRSNIKTEKYDLLAREFRAAGLPLFVDVMLGLPGSTTASFRNDLQQCIDREVTAKIFQTEVLVNSPMNEPAYRELHQIETARAGSRILDSRIDEDGTSRRAMVVSTATFTREDRAEMLDLRRVFRLLDNFSVLRQFSRYIRQETGVREVDFMDRLRLDSRDRERWPVISLTLNAIPAVMVPPISWRLFMDEVERYVVEELGVADDDALRTVLAVNHAILPASGRSFPLVLDLPHDFTAWHQAVIAQKEDGHTDTWTDVVPHLREFGPAPFVVEDPRENCVSALGFHNEDDFSSDWELSSPVARAMPSLHQEYA